MLSSIRSGLRSKTMSVLLGLLIASFALWGIPDLFSTIGAGAVAEVDGAEISDAEFARAYEQQLRTIEAQIGEPLDREQALQFGLPGQVLQQMVVRLGFDLHAGRLGLRASNEEVVETLRGFEAFEGFDGRFDRRAYETQLSLIGLTPKQFENQLRGDIVRGRLVEALTAAAPVPTILAEELFRHRKQARRAIVLSVPLDLAGEIAEPGEEEVRETYERDKDLYMTPAYREVAVAGVSPAAFAKPEEVTGEELRQAYEERIDEYRIAEKREVDLVTFGLTDEAQARRFVERVQGGEPFEDVVASMTDFSPEEIALGEVTRSGLGSDYNARIAEAVFAADPGGLSAPAQSVFGWHVFRIRSVTPAEERAFEDVAEELAREIAEDRAYDAIYDISVAAEESLARGADLLEIARTHGLSYARAVVTRDGLLREGGLAPEEILDALETAWSMTVEEPPVLSETGGGGFVIVDVLGEFPPEQRPFEEVAEQVRARILRDRRLAAVGELAERIAGRVRAGEPAAAVATDTGAGLVETGWIVRDEIGRTSEVAPAVARLLFQIGPGDVEIERAATGEGYVVVRLEEIRQGDPAVDPEGFSAFQEQIERDMLSDALEQYQRSLLDRLGVEINSARVNQIVDPQASF